MNKDQSTYQYIVDYLQGRLGSEERIQLEKRLREDAAFASYVAQHKLANEVIMQNEISNIKSKLKTIHEVESGKGGASIQWLSWLLGVVVLLGVGIWYYTNTDRQWSEGFPEHGITNAIEKNEIGSANKIKNGISEIRVADANADPISTDNNEKKNNNLKRHTRDGSAEKVTANPTDAKKKQTVSIPTSGIHPLPNKLPSNKSKVIDQNRDAAKDCDGFAMDFEVLTTATCIDRHQGMAEIVIENNDGYRYAMNEQASQSTNLFKGLEAGVYRFFIVDSRGCYSDPVQAEVSGRPCDFVVQPSRDIYWDINLDGFLEDQVFLKIYDSKSGEMVYQKELDRSSQNEWQGIRNAGQPLPMGNYLYVLSSDSKNIQGNVTIVR